MNYLMSFFRYENFMYVMGAPYFWQAMAATTVCAMFIGTTLHNGDFDSIRKASITLLTYIFMLLLTTVARILPYYEEAAKTKTILELAQAYANPVTILLISFFWFLGLWWGVYLVNLTRHNRV